MRTCTDCCEPMVHSSRRIRVFSAAEEEATPMRVDADECLSCGKMVPSEGAVEKALHVFETPTVPGY